MSTLAPLAGPHRGIEQPISAAAASNSHKGRWSRLWAARFVAKWEGFLPDATLDTIAQPPVETIGFGHTGGVRAGEHWSKAHALRVLDDDVKWAAAAVAEKVKHRLTVRQRMALISFVFNLGPGVLRGDLLRHLNEGKIAVAAAEMLDYDHAGGVEIPGLRNRRESERWMMLHSRHPKNPHRKDPRHAHHR